MAAPADPSYGASGDTFRPQHLIKSQAFRTLMLLSALASSGLVLEAARRW